MKFVVSFLLIDMSTNAHDSDELNKRNDKFALTFPFQLALKWNQIERPRDPWLSARSSQGPNYLIIIIIVNIITANISNIIVL